MTDVKLGSGDTKGHASIAKIKNAWYIAMRSSDLKKKPQSMTIMDTPLVLFRTESGVPGALLDRCPHRNVPLSGGKVEGERLVCCYHGWEFNVEGECCHVPGLATELKNKDRSRRAPSWPVLEQDGFVWVYMDPDETPKAGPFQMPKLPGYTEARREVFAPGTLHATLENALDVPHTAFVHGGLFRTKERHNTIQAVVKRYPNRVEAEYIGEPRPKGLVAKLLAPEGGVVTHFDRFFLPSIAQVEYRIGEGTHLLVTAAGTPVSDFETKLFAFIQFKIGRLPGGLVKLLLEPFGRFIFHQDQEILKAQTEAIKRFGGERYESTEIDLLGPQIWRLMKDAERGTLSEEDEDTVLYEKTVSLHT